MSLGSGFLENIPHFTFTPSEHQVECVRVGASRNVTYVLPQQHEKSFLALMAIKERSNYIRAGLGKALVLLYKKHQVSLWGNFLGRMTDLKVEEIKEDVDVDTGQLLGRLETGGVIVSTHSYFSSLLSRKLISLSSFNLVIVDNIQASLGTKDTHTFLQAYRNIPRNQAPRLIFFTPNILKSNPPHLQSRVPQQLSRLEQLLPAAVECSCEVATQLRFLARPREIIVLHKSSTADPSFPPEEQIRNILEEIKDWIEDQNYSLYDTYGEEFQDLIADIPDPTFTPLNIIQEFISVLDNLGLWCADRAALVLLIKIDKLKTREKYERHFLLLSVLFTAMIKIRKICDDFFGDMDDYDRIVKFSKPKVLKLIQLLNNYVPKVKVKPVEHGSSPDASENTELTSSRPGSDSSQDQVERPGLEETTLGVSRESTAPTGEINKSGDFSNSLKPGKSNMEPKQTSSEPSKPMSESKDFSSEPEKPSSELENPSLKPENPSLEPENSSLESEKPSSEPDHSIRPNNPSPESEDIEPTESSLKNKPNSTLPGKGRGLGRKGMRRVGPAPEDPEALCSLLIVNSTFHAKILYHYLKDLSRSIEKFSFICPQYSVSDTVYSDPRDTENEKKKQEEALRRFRMRESNILVSSSVLEEGIDFVKCNLVIMFDAPATFSRYIYTKVKCKSVYGSLVYLCEESRLDELRAELTSFKSLETQILDNCTNKAADVEDDIVADKYINLLPLYPSKPTLPGVEPSLLSSPGAVSTLQSNPGAEPTLQSITGAVPTLQPTPEANVIPPLTPGEEEPSAVQPDCSKCIESSETKKTETYSCQTEPVVITNPSTSCLRLPSDSKSQTTSPPPGQHTVALPQGIHPSAPPLSLNSSILILNRYCAKLPSDTFTRLTPTWTVQRTPEDKFYCVLFLPINSPLKELVVGCCMPSPSLARRAAAYQASVQLHQIKELDDNLMPLGKESILNAVRPVSQILDKKIDPISKIQEENTQPVSQIQDETMRPVSQIQDETLRPVSQIQDETMRPVSQIQDETMRPGTTKRRQYYYKRVAPCLTNGRKTTISKVNNTKSADTVNIDETSLSLKTLSLKPEEPEKKCDTNFEYKEGVLDPSDPIEEHEMKMDSSESPEVELDRKLGLELREKFPNLKYYSTEEDTLLRDRYSNISVPSYANYNLYAMRMHLTCPIPEEQNTRGRKIYDPADSDQLFGILLPNNMPVIPSFPIYTRSGEVLVNLVLVQQGIHLNTIELKKVFTYHVFTFYSVLRLEKYPMVFNCEEEHNCAVFVPLSQKNGDLRIDWEFLDVIQYLSTKRLRSLGDEERREFKFEIESYNDSVIMPWYRNQDQPQYFYVAEVCEHLNPTSDFPGQGFETFEKYYGTKYEINIQNLSQPLLDVDHTSARLNFLTPRYVNRKGIALPTSSDETKKNKRENLDQKQILVPELCAIHPFSASLWRQTVALPCAMYRLNGLLIADQIRHAVSVEMKFGVQTLPDTFTWPPLNFGWTLADVVKNTRSESKISPSDEKSSSEEIEKIRLSRNSSLSKDGFEEEEMIGVWEEEGDMGKMADRLLSKLAAEEKLNRRKKLEIGTWNNDMANQGSDWGADDEDEGGSDDELALAGIELPDNLTFIPSIKTKPQAEGSKDWGTGIETKNFRVGSPTCFTGNNMAGLMDDLEGFSCSDSEEDWEEEISDSESEKPGRARIEFHGENVAETIEEESDVAAREERQAKDRDQETSMVQDQEWDPNLLLEVENLGEIDKPEIKIEIIEDSAPVRLIKQSDEVKPEVFEPDPEYTPVKPQLSHQTDLDTVLSNLGLCPDLSILKPIPMEEPGIIPWPDVDQTDVKFDYQPELSDHPGPSPSLILQALTMSNSNDAINLERLETIGDSFLKYAITSYLYCQYPFIHEGKLSHLRSKQVSNLNLYQLGRARGLGEFMIATKFEPHDNWLPPCYHVPRELEKALIESGVPASHWNMAELPGIEKMSSLEICQILRERVEKSFVEEDRIQDLPSFIPYNLLTQHSIPDKSIADCVEALIGAYLISCGPRGALLLMTWLQIKVLPGNIDAPGELVPPPSPLLRNPWSPNPEKELNYLLDGYNKFEHMIGYVWKDKSYLLQAFSHASYYPNRLTDCYQRLEFLGDAVLDYLITRHLYQDTRLHSPGALTDLRSALVNNTIFACLAVRFQFHKYFKHMSPGLQVVCDRFVRIQAENNWKVSEDCYLMDEDENEEAEDIEVPKALGDIFESIAGSIYLDSGLSLDAVWTVYYRMMKDEIEQFSSHVPKSPIRELLELEPETAKFGKPEKLADGRRVRVSVEVFGKGTFKGIGRNYRIAKCTAAKCALKALRKIESRNKKK